MTSNLQNTQSLNKQSLPLVSVLMPSFNSQAYIEEAIQSILAQTYGHFELLILDDGSTDDTLALISQFSDPRIRILKHSVNQGTVATRNDLIQAAQGKYIALLDNDDIAREDRLAVQVAFLEKDTADLCGSDHLTLNQLTGRLKRSKLCHSDADIRAMMTVACPLSHPSIMAKASVFKEHPYDLGTDVAEDYALWLRLSLAGIRFANLKQNLLTYRIHPKQFSQSKLDQVQKLLHQHQTQYVAGLGIDPKLTPQRLSWALRLKLGKQFMFALNHKIHGISLKTNYQIYARFQYRGNRAWTPLTRFERFVVALAATLIGRYQNLPQ